MDDELLLLDNLKSKQPKSFRWVKDMNRYFRKEDIHMASKAHEKVL